MARLFLVALLCFFAVTLDGHRVTFDQINLKEETSFEDIGAAAFGGAVAGAAGGQPDVSSVSIFDCNNDGLDDIFFPSSGGDNFKLFRNLGNFEFEDIIEQSGLPVLSERAKSVRQMQPIDFDNDGVVDVAMTGQFFTLWLFRGLGDCQFEDVTLQMLPTLHAYQLLNLARIGEPDFEGYGGFLAAGDFDNDGDLDMFVGSNGQFVNGFVFSGQSLLLENIRGNEFVPHSNVNSDIRLPDVASYVCAITFEDFDEDGWEDLVFSPCNGPAPLHTIFWKNYPFQDTRAFVDVTDILKLDNPFYNGIPMGLAWGDFNGDGHFDFSVSDSGLNSRRDGSLLSGPSKIHISRWKNGCLTDYEEGGKVLGLDRDLPFAFGVVAEDFDNDGWDDLANLGTFLTVPSGDGDIYRNVPTNDPRNPYGRRLKKIDILEVGAENAQGLATADFNHDGLIDMVDGPACWSNSTDPFELVNFCNLFSPLRLWRNVGPAPEAGINRCFLTVKLQGEVPATNFYGVGSLVTVTARGIEYEKKDRVRSGGSHGSVSALTAHFGIPVPKDRANYFNAVDVQVDWMGSGRREMFYRVTLNQIVTLTEGTGRTVPANWHKRCDFTPTRSVYNDFIVYNGETPLYAPDGV